MGKFRLAHEVGPLSTILHLVKMKFITILHAFVTTPLIIYVCCEGGLWPLSATMVVGKAEAKPKELIFQKPMRYSG